MENRKRGFEPDEKRHSKELAIERTRKTKSTIGSFRSAIFMSFFTRWFPSEGTRNSFQINHKFMNERVIACLLDSHRPKLLDLYYVCTVASQFKDVVCFKCNICFGEKHTVLIFRWFVWLLCCKQWCCVATHSICFSFSSIQGHSIATIRF